MIDGTDRFDPPLLVALDLELIKIGCPLLQAAMGGGSAVLELVSTETWLLHPTPELQVYALHSRWQLDFLVGRLEEKVRQERRVAGTK